MTPLCTCLQLLLQILYKGKYNNRRNTTFVTAITGVANIIDGAFSNGGILYGIQLSGSGNLGRINKTTGVWTTVGPLGIIPFYSQAAHLTEVTENYTGQHFSSHFVSDFRRIDTTTGASTVIGTIQNSALLGRSYYSFCCTTEYYWDLPAIYSSTGISHPGMVVSIYRNTVLVLGYYKCLLPRVHSMVIVSLISTLLRQGTTHR